MIIIHTADFHLGAALASLPEEIRLKRIEDFFNNLREIITFAVKNKADFFIIAGDVFQSTRPSSYIYNKFAQHISVLLREKIKVIVAAGNHDILRAKNCEPYIGALEKIASAYSKDFIFAYEPRGIILTSRDGKRVGFILLPYLPPKEDENEYSRRICSSFRRILNDLKEKECDYIVTVGHFLVEKAKVREKIYETDTPVQINCIWSSDVSYVALGHVHEFQHVSRNIVYSGSIEKITFAEENDQKYFVLIKEHGGDLEFIPIELNTRPLITLPKKSLNINSLDFSMYPQLDITEVFLNKLRNINIPNGAIVRIKYKIRSGQRLDQDAIYRLLKAKKALHTLFVPEIISGKRLKRPSPEALISIERAVKEYIDTLNLKPDLRKEVLRRTMEYLKEIQW